MNLIKWLVAMGNEIDSKDYLQCEGQFNLRKYFLYIFYEN